METMNSMFESGELSPYDVDFVAAPGEVATNGAAKYEPKPEQPAQSADPRYKPISGMNRQGPKTVSLNEKRTPQQMEEQRRLNENMKTNRPNATDKLKDINDDETDLNDDDKKESMYDSEGISVEKRKVTLDLATLLDTDSLYDMDDAATVAKIIKKFLLEDKVIILDFTGIIKIHSYFFTICLGKYMVKFKENVTKHIGVRGLSQKHLLVLNGIAKACKENGEKIMAGIDSLPQNTDDQYSN